MKNLVQENHYDLMKIPFVRKWPRICPLWQPLGLDRSHNPLKIFLQNTIFIFDIHYTCLVLTQNTCQLSVLWWLICDLHMGTPHRKKSISFGIARKGGGGPCPNFFTLFPTMLSLIFWHQYHVMWYLLVFFNTKIIKTPCRPCLSPPTLHPHPVFNWVP